MRNIIGVVDSFFGAVATVGAFFMAYLCGVLLPIAVWFIPLCHDSGYTGVQVGGLVNVQCTKHVNDKLIKMEVF